MAGSKVPTSSRKEEKEITTSLTTFKINFDDPSNIHKIEFYISPVLVKAKDLSEVLPIVYDILKEFMKEKDWMCHSLWSTASLEGCSGCEFGKYDSGCGSTFRPYLEKDMFKFLDNNSYNTITINEVRNEAIKEYTNLYNKDIVFN